MNVKQLMMKSPSKSFFLLAVGTLVLSILALVAQAEHKEDHKQHKYNPYKYGYKVIDHKSNKQWKQEESHQPHEVKGSYGYKDKHGMFREVSYIADAAHGFRVTIKTNEPGTASMASAGVKIEAHPDQSFYKQQSLGHHP